MLQLILTATVVRERFKLIFGFRQGGIYRFLEKSQGGRICYGNHGLSASTKLLLSSGSFR